MIEFDAGTVTQYAWIIFAAYWFVAAFRLNRMMKREPASDTLVRIIIGATAFILLYEPHSYFGALNDRFVPHAPWIRALGATLTCLGLGFAIWARNHIGRYWSSSVSLRAGHQLVRTGPYSRIRHPIYTGILLALAGTALLIGQYRALRICVEGLARGSTACQRIRASIRRPQTPHRILPAPPVVNSLLHFAIAITWAGLFSPLLFPFAIYCDFPNGQERAPRFIVYTSVEGVRSPCRCSFSIRKGATDD